MRRCPAGSLPSTAPKSGSTIDTAGSVPAAASAKNCCVVRRCRTAPAQPERVQVGGVRLVAADRVRHPGNPPADGRQPAQEHEPAPAEQPLEHDERRVHVVVVHPGDVVAGQRVEDRPGGRVVHQVPGQVVDQPVRGAADEEPPVRERRPEAGAEPAVGHREGPREPVVERQVLLGPVAHRDGRVRRRARSPRSTWRTRRTCRRRTRCGSRARSGSGCQGPGPWSAGARRRRAARWAAGSRR